MTDPQSANVGAGDTGYATQYNNLRLDVFNFAGIYLWTNNSGGSVAAGDVVVFDKSSSNYFKTTTVQGDKSVLGVVISTSISNGATGYIARRGNWRVNLNAAVTVGQALITSTVAKLAIPNGGAVQDGYIGFVTDASGSPTYCMADINPNTTRTGGQVTLVSTTMGNSTGSSPVTLISGLAVSGNNRLLVVAVSLRTTSGGSITSVSWNGTNMTRVGGSDYNDAGNPNSNFAIFYMLASPGTGNVVMTFVNTISASCCVAVVLNDVNQSTPVTTNGYSFANTTTPSIGHNCTPGDLLLGIVVQMVTGNSVSGRGGAQTQIGDTSSATFEHMVADKVDPAINNTNTFSWTFSGGAVNTWAAAIAVHPI